MVLVVWIFLTCHPAPAAADCIATGPNSSCRNAQAPVSNVPLAPAAAQNGCKLAGNDIFCMDPNTGSYQKANCQRESETQVMCLAADGSWQERQLLNAAYGGAGQTGLISARMPVGSTTTVVVPVPRTETIVVYPPSYGYGTQCGVLGIAYQTRSTRLGFLSGSCR
jgi:hypothetical protein